MSEGRAKLLELVKAKVGGESTAAGGSSTSSDPAVGATSPESAGGELASDVDLDGTSAEGAEGEDVESPESAAAPSPKVPERRRLLPQDPPPGASAPAPAFDMQAALAQLKADLLAELKQAAPAAPAAPAKPKSWLDEVWGDVPEDERPELDPKLVAHLEGLNAKVQTFEQAQQRVEAEFYQRQAVEDVNREFAAAAPKYPHIDPADVRYLMSKSRAVAAMPVEDIYAQIDALGKKFSGWGAQSAPAKPAAKPVKRKAPPMPSEAAGGSSEVEPDPKAQGLSGAAYLKAALLGRFRK